MTTPIIVPSPQQIKNLYLQTLQVGLDRAGIVANISEGSDWAIEGDALATMQSGLYNAMLSAIDAIMPDTCLGEDLDRWLSVVGLSRRGAGGSNGKILFVTDYDTFVPEGSQLTSADGTRYKVSQGGTYANNDSIPIESVDAGASTNLEEGILTWVSPPVGAQTTVNISSPLVGGIDAEVDDVARARLLDRFAHPPAAANWQWLVELAERTDTAVLKAFVYPAHNGPSTAHIANAGPQSSAPTAQGPILSREIDSVVMAQTITPTILGNMPEFVETTITTVDDLPVDVALSLTIPLAKSASSSISGPGNGTGWLDGSPFPRVNSDTHFFIPVVGVVSASQIQISSPAGFDPIPNISRIQWVDRSTWSVKTATITSFNIITPGQYELFLNRPFVGILPTEWIMPASLRAQEYLDAIVKSFALMGPGEKVNIGTQPLAARKPRPSDGFPCNLDSSLLRAVINAGEEVQTASYYYRSTSDSPSPSDGSTVNTVVVPPIPLNITDPPKILVPRRIAWYAPIELT